MKRKLIAAAAVVLLGAAAVTAYYFIHSWLEKRNAWQPPTEQLAFSLNESSQLISSGDNAGARSMLEKLAKENPSSEMVPYNLGITWMNEQHYEKAIHYFSRSIKIHPTLGAHLNRAWCYKALGKHQEAVDDYTRVLVMNPDFSHAYYERGFQYMLLKRGDKAREDLLRARDLGITKAQALLDQLQEPDL